MKQTNQAGKTGTGSQPNLLPSFSNPTFPTNGSLSINKSAPFSTFTTPSNLFPSISGLLLSLIDHYLARNFGALEKENESEPRKQLAERKRKLMLYFTRILQSRLSPSIVGDEFQLVTQIQKSCT